MRRWRKSAKPGWTERRRRRGRRVAGQHLAKALGTEEYCSSNSPAPDQPVVKIAATN